MAGSAMAKEGALARFSLGIFNVGEFGTIPATTSTGAEGDLLFATKFFEVGAGFKYRFKKNCVTLLQPRAVLNVRLAQGTVEPYIGANMNYTIYDYNCPLYQWQEKGVGFGAQAGAYIRTGSQISLFFEAQVDTVSLLGLRVWTFGGSLGLAFLF
jgi:hypothetical protein